MHEPTSKPEARAALADAWRIYRRALAYLALALYNLALAYTLPHLAWVPSWYHVKRFSVGFALGFAGVSAALNIALVAAAVARTHVGVG